MTNLNTLIVQIKEAFPTGNICEYLEREREPDAEKIEEMLRSISTGGKPGSDSEISRDKASILLRRLTILKEDGTLEDS